MKYIVSILITLGVVLLTGCSLSEEKIVCTMKENVDDMYMSTEVTAIIKDDKVSSLSGTLTFDSENTATSYYSFISLYDQNLKQNETLDVELNGKKIFIGNFQYLIEENQEDKIIGQEKDDFKKIMENENFSCK